MVMTLGPSVQLVTVEICAHPPQPAQASVYSVINDDAQMQSES